MPTGGGAVTGDDLQLVADWILAGARNKSSLVPE